MDAVAALQNVIGETEDLEARYGRLLREHGPALRRAAVGIVWLERWTHRELRVLEGMAKKCEL